MTAQELSGRVHHNVGTVLKRPDLVRGTECVVDDQGESVAVGHSGHALYVRYS